MSEINLEKELAEEREKLRLNSLRTLKFLGYKHDAAEMTQEQIDARIELMMDKKENEKIEATKNGKVEKPAFFSGIDGEKENIDKVANAAPSELDLSEFMNGYDALTAQIQVLRPNSQVGHYTALSEREEVRIIRLPASIRLNEHESILKRVLL